MDGRGGSNSGGDSFHDGDARSDDLLQPLSEYAVSADFLRSAIEQSNRVFFVFSADGSRTHYVSPAYKLIWGQSRKSIFKNPAYWLETLHDEDRERVTGAVADYAVHPEKARVPLEYRIVRPDGGVRWLRGYVFLCRSITNGASLLGGMAEDITEEKLALEAREKARAELEEMVRVRTAELTRANEALQAEIERRGEIEHRLRRQQKFLTDLIQVQDLERKLIAHDLHDDLMQSVVAAKGRLETAVLELPAGGKSHNEAREGLRLLSDVLGEARRMIAGIRPQTLDDLGLAAAVEEQARAHAEDGFAVEFRTELGGLRFSPIIELTAYRVVQEALSNVRRHGEIDCAVVELGIESERLRVRIFDEGRGFELAAVAEKEFGLQDIRLRAAAVGGAADIESAPGRGTIITVRLPLLDPTQIASAERDRAEEALHVSRARFQAILDRTSAVIFVKDHVGRYTLINRRYEELFHVERETFIGKTDLDFFPPAVAEALRENDRRVLREGRPITVEESVPSNGEMREYVSVKFPIPGECGEPPALCGIATDITEQKRETVAREEMKNRFQSFMDHTPMLAWIKDAEGRYVFANRRMLDVQRVAWEQLAGRTDFDLFPRDVAEGLREHDSEVLRTGKMNCFQERAPAGEGEALQWLSYKFPLFAGDGAPLVGGVAFDVTQPPPR